MDWPTGVSSVPGYVAVAVPLLLAGLLLYLDFQKRMYRAFAAFLFFRATSLLVGMFRGAADTPAEWEFWQRLAPYFLIPVIPTLIYFLALYPRPRGWFGVHRWGGWSLLIVTLLAEGLYVLDHDLFWSYAPGVAQVPTLAAGFGQAYVAFGPLMLFQAATLPATAIAAWILIRDARREALGSARFSILLIAAGILLSNLFFSPTFALDLPKIFAHAATYPWWPAGWAFVVLPPLGFLLTIGALVPVYLAYHDPSDEMLKGEAGRILVAAPLPLATFLLLAVTNNGNPLRHEYFLLCATIWRSVLPLVAVYGLIRYQLFDIDSKVKTSIQHATVAMILAATFFAVSEGVEFLAGAKWGQWSGLGAAALMTVALRPLEQLGGRVAARLMPGTKPLHSLSSTERQSHYDAQITLALQDGRLTTKERRMLENLQSRLGLPTTPIHAGEAGGRRAMRARA